jgi:membrane protein YdbS with pleckstrin-like domain
MKKFISNPQPGEKTVLILRRFWFTALNIILVGILLFLVPFGVTYLLMMFSPELLDDPIITPILASVAVIYYLAVWLFAFTDFVDYYLDVWVITTGRILNIEQHGLFKRASSELNLSSIQDVTAEINGPLQTFFKYGNVYVQTAAERMRFHMKNVANAEEVKATIMRLSEEDRMKENTRFTK